jgi:hypothetical protein
VLPFHPSLRPQWQKPRANGWPNHPPNRVSEQKTADSFAANSLITRKTGDERSWDEVIARQAFRLFGRQVDDGECEGTQAMEPDDPALIVNGDENTRHVAFFVLTGTKMEPIIERRHPARERRAVMLAERFDRFDHARSTEKIATTLQCFDKARRRIRLSADRREEGVAIRSRQHHALMLVEEPPRALIGKIAGGKTGDRHSLLD